MEAGTQSSLPSYRRLKAWERAMDLAVECDVLARRISKRRATSLAAQMQRASVSIPSNIAEGNGRRTRADYLRHLYIANGSLLEVETQLLLAQRLALVQPSEMSRALSLASEVGRILAGLIRKLSESPGSPERMTQSARGLPTIEARSSLPLPTDPVPVVLPRP